MNKSRECYPDSDSCIGCQTPPPGMRCDNLNSKHYGEYTEDSSVVLYRQARDYIAQIRRLAKRRPQWTDLMRRMADCFEAVNEAKALGRDEAEEDHEPGEPITECTCPNCGAQLSVEYGDDEGEIAVVSSGCEDETGSWRRYACTSCVHDLKELLPYVSNYEPRKEVEHV